VKSDSGLPSTICPTVLRSVSGWMAIDPLPTLTSAGL
jgi:hypothetical protein